MLYHVDDARNVGSVELSNMNRQTTESLGNESIMHSDLNNIGC